jgi:TonB family protein
MSLFKMLVAFMACWTAIGIAQKGAEIQSQAEAPPPQTVHVSPAAMTGMVDHKVLPQYPQEAMKKGVEGDVVFNIVVDESGKVVDSHAVSGNPLLVAASADALREYRYRPYQVDGNPVRVESQVGFHFALDRQGDSTTGHVECMSSIP